MPERVWLAWSSGKDSAYALHVIRSDPAYELAGLLTTVTRPFDRVAMHGLRTELLDAQARALGLPVYRVEIPHPCPNPVYEEAMRRALGIARGAGIRGIVFGDLFLESVRDYREERLEGSGLRPIFPLWGIPTGLLAQRILRLGFRATLSCVDPRQMNPAWAGREYDAALLEQLPATVDPCGERGEFHTFVHDGPIFPRPIAIQKGEVVVRDGFVFADLLPA